MVTRFLISLLSLDFPPRAPLGSCCPRMQRAPTLVFLVHRHAAQPTLRAFSTHPALLSKASKDRRVKWTRPASKATTNPGQAGTDAARAGAPTTGGGLFEGEQDVTPDAIERDMLAVQGEVRRQVGNGKERENLAGTDVGAGGQPSVQPSPPPSSSGSKGPEEQASVEGPGELIYTSTPPFNVPLMLSVSFVMSVFCLACADFAWTGIELYDEETGTYEVTPAWKRYTLAGSAATVGVGIAVWGSLAPTRLITRMTLHRTAGSMHSPLPFPRDSTVVLEARLHSLLLRAVTVTDSRYTQNPLTPLLRKIGQKPRAVPLARIRLLGPISASAKPYHPLTQAEPSKPPGVRSSVSLCAKVLL